MGRSVTVLGHPGGGTLSFSIADNELLDYEDTGFKLHYRTPTEGGSSGSPVFNQEWRLIGLHHAGGDAMCPVERTGRHVSGERRESGSRTSGRRSRPSTRAGDTAPA